MTNNSCWRPVGTDLSYWIRDNSRINPDNAKFVCGACAGETTFDWVCDCGRTDAWALGKGGGLPGIFCHDCGDGRITLTLMLSFLRVADSGPPHCAY